MKLYCENFPSILLSYLPLPSFICFEQVTRLKETAVQLQKYVKLPLSVCV